MVVMRTMPVAAISILLIIGGLALAGILLVFFLLRIARNLLMQVRQTLPPALLNQLSQSVKSGEFDWQQQEPVSLSGMDTIYRPQIQADFPELNLEELKHRAERLAYSTLTAIDAEDPDGLSETGDLYLASFKHYLAGLQSLGQHEHYADITIHKTVIANYQKNEGTCRISFQLAIGAKCARVDTDGQVIAGRSDLTQFKFTAEALYVQDPALLNAQELEALAINCPNCGAPVTTLGERHCPYCNSTIEPLNNKAWIFTSFQKSWK